ncbi:MAG TPA: sulfotransferase [Stellaceae bacterium]|nr:sulfotransferase [Stellaceae bacterium]
MSPSGEARPDAPPAASRVVRPHRGFHYRYPRWGLRPWFGMPLAPWLSLLARHRFAVSRARLPTVLLITVVAAINSLLGAFQALLHGRRIAAIPLGDDPIFIIGHWRAGTTFLHELLALDERFVWPTTYECFAPGHFLVSRWLAPLLRRLAPARRPMDAMQFGLDRPQEDEWALALLGLGSPYETIAFPDHRPVRDEFLTLRGLAESTLRRWQAGLRCFLQSVQLRAEREGRGARCLLLKSPTHTARVAMLCRMFPKARFIHVVRDPEELFASTVRLWTVLFDIFGCHKPHRDGLPNGTPGIEEYVLRTLPLLYDDFDHAREAVPAHRWHEVRFEHLVDDPIGEIEEIYRRLELGSFETVRRRLSEYVRGNDGARSEYALPPELRGEVAARWAEYRRRYGY